MHAHGLPACEKLMWSQNVSKGAIDCRRHISVWNALHSTIIENRKLENGIEDSLIWSKNIHRLLNLKLITLVDLTIAKEKWTRGKNRWLSKHKLGLKHEKCLQSGFHSHAEVVSQQWICLPAVPFEILVWMRGSSSNKWVYGIKQISVLYRNEFDTIKNPSVWIELNLDIPLFVLVYFCTSNSQWLDPFTVNYVCMCACVHLGNERVVFVCTKAKKIQWLMVVYSVPAFLVSIKFSKNYR